MQSSLSRSPEVQSSIPTPLIDLERSCQSKNLLPAASIAYASRSVLTDPYAYADALHHGPALGSTPLRHEIAAWLTKFYTPDAGIIPPERICITGGASQNLSAILQKFTDPVYTRSVSIVAPMPQLLCRVFEDNGLEGKIRAIPEDSGGVDIAILTQLILEEEAKATSSVNVRPVFKSPTNYPKIYRHIIFCTPTFKNPTTKTMSIQRREELIKVARKFDALIIADDIFDFLRWGENAKSEKPWPRIVDIDREMAGGSADGFGNAISNGSFSKIIAPGCRVGWLEGAEKFVATMSEVGSTKAGGAPSQLASTFIWNILTTDTLQSHLDNVLLPTYSKRHASLVAAINSLLSSFGVTIPNTSHSVAGGWFLWLHLPSWCNAKELCQKLQQQQNLVVTPGENFSLQSYPGGMESNGLDNYIRICFAWEDEDRLVQGIGRLKDGLEKMNRESGRGSVSGGRGLGITDLIDAS